MTQNQPKRVARPTVHRLLLLAAAVLLPAGAVLAQVDAPAGPDEPYATTHVIAKLKPGQSPVRDADGQWSIRPSGPQALGAVASAVDATLRRHGVDGIEPALRLTPQHAEVASSLGLDRYYLLSVPEGGDVALLAAALSGHRDVVEHVELDGTGGVADVVPDDAQFGLQYALLNTGQVVDGIAGFSGADIRATEAWSISTGSSDVTLAILDSGVDPHPELDGRMLPGWNAVLGNDNTSDSCFGHGTHVCGSAAANAANGQGIAGVNWNVSILPVRILNGCGGVESDLANGITWAVDNGADVINMSLQFSSGTTFLHDAVLYADAAGVVMIAASGNNGFSGGVAFPGRWPETIAVAATDNRDFRASFSNSGPEVDVAAPGKDIYSLAGISGYAYRDGTSMASPHVAGVASLMLAVDPTLEPAAIRSYLTDTAVDVGAAGFDSLTGWGRIDAFAALEAVQEDVTVTGDVDGDGDVDIDDLIAVIMAWGPCADEVPCPADIDGNANVNVDDLVAVIMNWT